MGLYSAAAALPCGCLVSVRSVYFKIVTTSLQQNALALSYSFDWQGVADKLLRAQASLASLGTTYLDFRCLVKSNENTFVKETILYIVGPVAIVVAVFLVSMVTGRHDEEPEGGVSKPQLPPALHDPPTLPRVRGVTQKMRESGLWQRSVSSSIGVATTMLYLLQPTLVNRFALVLSCVQLGTSPQAVFLSQDLTIPCWQRQHIFYICTLGLPLLLLYVVGVPLAVLYTLCSEDNKPRVLHILSTVRAVNSQPILDDFDNAEQAPPQAQHST